jgi:hypothetical protein
MPPPLRMGTAEWSLLILLPVSSLLLGWFGLDETVAPSAFGSMALIGVGFAAIDGRPARRVWYLLPAAPAPAVTVSALVGLFCAGRTEQRRWQAATRRRQS